MANDDQQRSAAGSGHAVELKPEFRALADRAKELAKREERRWTEQMKADTQKKAEAMKAEERRIAESRRQEEKKRAERKQESLRKEAERRIDNGKAVVEKERTRRQFSRQAEDRNKAQAPATGQDKSHAVAADIRRRAAQAVAERQQRQKAQQQEEHRRQTDHMRTLHHGEMHSFKENEDAANARHAHEIESINEREQHALAALGAHRESLIGRAVTFFKGEAHYAREADSVVERCEVERMAAHRNLETLKERQFAAAQQSRLRQAQERKGIAELHRMERQQLAQSHDRSREREIGVSQRTFERVAERKDQTQEDRRGWYRGLSQ
jgi:colicin import membrane protein